MVVPPHGAARVSEFFESWPLFKDSSRRVRINTVRFMGRATGESRADHEAARSARAEALKRFVENRKRTSFPHDGLFPDLDLLHVRIAQSDGCALPSEVTPSGFCIPGARKLFVTASGDLGMCDKVNDRLPIGSLDRGFDYDRIEKLLIDLCGMWRPDCSSCFAQRYCGVCPDQVDSGGRVDRTRFGQVCRATRAAFKLALASLIMVQRENETYLKDLQGVQLT